MTSEFADTKHTNNRLRGHSVREERTFATELLKELENQVYALTHLTWPSQKYRYDPVGFSHDIMGVKSWEKMTEMLEAVRDHDLVFVRAGQKVSKTYAAMILALWWYCCGGKVRMTSSTLKQVENVLYTQLLILRSEAGLCWDCKQLDPKMPKPCPHSALIDGTVGKLSRTGVRPSKADDFRIIQGFTSGTAEGLAGYSGVDQLWILDESSGINDEIYEAVRGNLIAGGKLLCLSNPTKTYGFFYDAFHTKAKHTTRIHISAFDSPNVKENRVVFPGLATRHTIEQLRDDYGEHSAVYRVRALGEFDDLEEGHIFTPHLLDYARDNQAGAIEHGLALSIGIDPSGATGRGDESAWVAIRGQRMLRLEGHLGLSTDDHLAKLIAWLNDLSHDNETPYVSIDREGFIGSRIYFTIKNWAESKSCPLRVRIRGIRASSPAIRKPTLFLTIRDELADSLYGWIKDGGGLMHDEKLSADLRALEWTVDDDNKGRTKLVAKNKLRKVLGRSPDRYDALSFAVWNGKMEAQPQPRIFAPIVPASRNVPILNPHTGRDAFVGKR